LCIVEHNDVAFSTMIARAFACLSVVVRRVLSSGTARRFVDVELD
jgi:hypothetical protein